MTLRDARVGDWVRFGKGHGRKRQVKARWTGGLSFVQLHDGVIGTYRNVDPTTHWKHISLADGQRLTSYTWSDLARMGGELVRDSEANKLD